MSPFIIKQAEKQHEMLEYGWGRGSGTEVRLYMYGSSGIVSL